MDEQELNLLTKKVIGAALEVHRTLGPGMLESVYEQCLIKELKSRGLHAENQVKVPVCYKGEQIEEQLTIDVLVEDELVLELMSVDVVAPVDEAQLLSCLKLANKRLGLLINFNVPLLKDGIRRKIFGKDHNKTAIHSGEVHHA